MPVYYLSGKPLNDTFKNLFFPAGAIDGNSIFQEGLNIYEYDAKRNLTSLKTSDGVKKYSVLTYIFGKPEIIMATMAMLSAYQLKGNYIITELDPVFKASPAATIGTVDIGKWNSAFSWGNHVGLYKPLSYVPAWSEISGKPTTISGFGITDAYTKSAVDSAVGTREPSVTQATTDKYYRGDKTFQTLNTAAVPESTNNKYYTDARVQTYGDSRYMQISGFNLTGGSAIGPTALVAGQTASVTVNFSKAFTDANYIAIANVTSSLSLLGSVQLQGISSKTATGCVVTLKNSGIISINLSTLVIEVVAIKIQ